MSLVVRYPLLRYVVHSSSWLIICATGVPEKSYQPNVPSMLLSYGRAHGHRFVGTIYSPSRHSVLLTFSTVPKVWKSTFEAFDIAELTRKRWFAGRTPMHPIAFFYQSKEPGSEGPMLRLPRS